MQRTQMAALRAWKDSAARKPLLLQGVRQCGKTWLLKEFGRTAFSSMVNVNFDENPEYAQFFEVKDVKRIIQNLALVTGKPIIPGQTLLVLDEIQDSPAALNALKYFREHMPNLHVAAAGSLLGVALAGKGFPVGQVDFMKLHPLSFTEFLQANGDDRLVAYLAQIDDLAAIPDAFLHPLEEQLRAYFITGGLPEPVGIWAERRDMAGVEAALSAILRAYELDFAKHAKATDFPKISLIWRSLPTQLGRENQKFLYQSVKPGARAREYEDALQWLARADLVTQVFRSTRPGWPLPAYDDLSAFKIYLGDIGVLRRLAGIDASILAGQPPAFTEFRGVMAENYALQALTPQLDVAPRYWSHLNPSHEVDFLLQYDDSVIPVEVKSGTVVTSRSLTYYQTKFGTTTPLRVRLSGQNLQLKSGLLNIPLPLADQAQRLIGLALGIR